MVNCKLVGVKHAVGVGKSGKPFDFYKACFVSDMTAAEVQQGSAGQSVHDVLVPDALLNVLNTGNVGKDFQADFYFANGNERIGYAMLVDKK